MRRTARDQARELRRHATAQERRLWQQLRGRRLEGFRFRRQHPVGHYILDFYCYERRLAVELDGYGHSASEHQIRDSDRSARLEREGIKVLRFWNSDVDDRIESVAQEILTALRERGDEIK